jgi:hypothetical protein
MNLYVDGSRDQLLVERSLRDIIENTKQAVEDMRYVLYHI